MLSSTSRKDRARGDKREQGGRHGAFRDGWSRARRDGSGAGGRGSLLRARAHVCGRRERSARPRRRAQVVQRCGGAGLSPGGVAAERGGAGDVGGGDVGGGDRRGSARGADVSDPSLTKNKKSSGGGKRPGALPGLSFSPPRSGLRAGEGAAISAPTSPTAQRFRTDCQWPSSAPFRSSSRTRPSGTSPGP